MVKPEFTTDFPEAVVREGADELTLRAEVEGMLRTFIFSTNGSHRSWMRICQAIVQGVDGEEWETMYYKYIGLHQAVECEKYPENKKAKALWSLTEAKDKGVNFDALGSVHTIPGRTQARLDLWAIHRKGPTAALANALERAEQEMLDGITSNERIAIMEVMSSEDEDDLCSF